MGRDGNVNGFCRTNAQYRAHYKLARIRERQRQELVQQQTMIENVVPTESEEDNKRSRLNRDASEQIETNRSKGIA